MNICADCYRTIGTCSWEKNFVPVDGWEAKKTTVMVQYKGPVESYNVVSCPLFVPHPKSSKPRRSKSRPIIATNIVTGETIIFPSVRAAEKTNDFLESSIHKCLAGKQQVHYGYTFQYLDAEDVK